MSYSYVKPGDKITASLFNDVAAAAFGQNIPDNQTFIHTGKGSLTYTPHIFKGTPQSDPNNKQMLFFITFEDKHKMTTPPRGYNEQSNLSSMALINLGTSLSSLMSGCVKINNTFPKAAIVIPKENASARRTLEKKDYQEDNEEYTGFVDTLMLNGNSLYSAWFAKERFVKYDSSGNILSVKDDGWLFIISDCSINDMSSSMSTVRRNYWNKSEFRGFNPELTFKTEWQVKLGGYTNASSDGKSNFVQLHLGNIDFKTKSDVNQCWDVEANLSGTRLYSCVVTNPYYTVGGTLYTATSADITDCLNPSIGELRPYIALRVNTEGSDAGKGTIMGFKSLTDMSATNEYIYRPMYLLNGIGGIELDLRNIPDITMLEPNLASLEAY